jgi:hypothetical protein
MEPSAAIGAEVIPDVSFLKSRLHTLGTFQTAEFPGNRHSVFQLATVHLG